ncbi:MAG: hypothetical protein ISS01_02430 [Nanoarchaeota archaeon]|nr:hypothetical protein [Nanoarchaeota archaeon]
MDFKLLTFIFTFIFVVSALVFVSLTAMAVIDDLNPTTKEEALAAIAIAEEDMQEMVDSNFSVNAVNDTILAAYNAYERAEFAHLLEENVSGPLLEEARSFLIGLNYEGFSYVDVILYTNQVTELKIEAYDVYDHLTVLEQKIEEYKLEYVDTEEAKILLDEAYQEFYFERYTSTREIISEANLILEDNRARSTALKIVSISGQNFFFKHWLEISIAIIILIITSFFGYKYYRKKYLERKLKKLKSEEISIKQLMKDTQRERFEKFKLSAPIYNIRMEYYSRRLNEIRSKIPVVQETLIGIKKKGKKKKSKTNFLNRLIPKKTIKKRVKRKVSKKKKSPKKKLKNKVSKKKSKKRK